MDVKVLYERGVNLRRRIFGDRAVEGRMNALGDFGEPLQHIVNAYAYGDVWSRPGLPLKTKSPAFTRDHRCNQPRAGVPRAHGRRAQ